MCGALESQERVDGRDGRRIGSPNAYLGAEWTIGSRVGDLGAASRHDKRTWDLLGMHLKRLGEVSGSKCSRDIAHVLADRGDPGGVRDAVDVKDNAPTIYQVFKNVADAYWSTPMTV